MMVTQSMLENLEDCDIETDDAVACHIQLPHAMKLAPKSKMPLQPKMPSRQCSESATTESSCGNTEVDIDDWADDWDNTFLSTSHLNGKETADLADAILDTWTQVWKDVESEASGAGTVKEFTPTSGHASHFKQPALSSLELRRRRGMGHLSVNIALCKEEVDLSNRAQFLQQGLPEGYYYSSEGSLGFGQRLEAKMDAWQRKVQRMLKKK